MTIFAIVVTAIVGIVNVADLQRRIEQISHTNIVISRIAELSALMTEVQTATRGFVITGNDHFLPPCDVAIDLIPARVLTLAQLLADNPQLQQAMTALQVTLQKVCHSIVRY